MEDFFLQFRTQSSSTEDKSEPKRGMKKDDQTTGFQEKDKMNNKVCPVCNRSFSSGKALGGHLRIHVLAKKDLSFIRKKNVNQPIKSKKRLREDEEISASLCGHMRCHPEKNWREIQPPTMVINSTSSKIGHRNVDNQIDSLTDADENQTIDSIKSFQDSSMTAKRGQKDTRATSEFFRLEG
ncbi:zinc finger protein ZAT3-like [Forsythia ovata]|uniref:Zinc finger protein ZAT3-like n=1 Tax=Forsythia ovata TaxID=205694 RepID=A0ABD1XCV4_9LAMI